MQTGMATLHHVKADTSSSGREERISRGLSPPWTSPRDPGEPPIALGARPYEFDIGAAAPWTDGSSAHYLPAAYGRQDPHGSVRPTPPQKIRKEGHAIRMAELLSETITDALSVVGVGVGGGLGRAHRSRFDGRPSPFSAGALPTPPSPPHL
ncbi:hypothetical protein K488DRAFT_84723 [Vararia minispora EC-137]|uniref:Uncharacterized protein n=1 Tax=Vararia minispora EC-137 TaxID=1314806 RepID=A0ACB8QPS9_9AGAM|nr:hypothetical protein K488DRAFT_84723 [Vararia minispora EC-137]